jgi:trehalose 6-phosphate synthase
MNESVVIASYRGPQPGNGGNGRSAKAAGGLIQVLAPWTQERAVLWVSATEEATDGDREEVNVPVAIDPSWQSGHYDVISNSVLWPLFHGLSDWVANTLRDTESAESAWRDYRAVNHRFAERISDHAAQEAVVVVHDYQLLLVPGALARMRPDLRIAYFHHIPFASASEFRLVPGPWRAEIASSVACVACGFQSPRWKSRFLDFCDGENIDYSPDAFVAPVCPDIGNLARDVRSSEVLRLRRVLRERIGERKLIARVDRADPMKNVLGGVHACEALLAQNPSWTNNFAFVHHLVPTRGSINRYNDYLDEVLDAVATVNSRWSTPEWQPIHINIADHREYGLALLAEYDVLLVNPIREGMNLVAYEGPSVNTRDGVVVLSEEAGAYDLLGPGTLGIVPASPDDTAAKLLQALSLPVSKRAIQAEELKAIIQSVDRTGWHDELVRAAAPPQTT